MKLDILVFAAHPDDAELSCGGTIATYVKRGKSVGVIDLTRGEMGTRGTQEIRDEESKNASQILQLSVRDNLSLRDSFFEKDEVSLIKVIEKIRQYRPDIVLANAIKDRHPDHARAAEVLQRAFFISGLKKVNTTLNNEAQEPWRPRVMYHYIQSEFIKPDFVADVSEGWEMKMEAVKAYKSQFYDPNSDEPETYISSPEFMKMIEARGKELGHSIGVRYGEGFTINRYLGVSDVFALK
ncbi:MAG: bacillithiol biosynthesis deacetylase BshB1 [Bacteroidota bacterium]